MRRYVTDPSENMVNVRFRLDFAPGSSVGPGKIDLLSAIEEEGSLSAAARSVGMSYRRAWLLLDGLNRSFATRVTTASVGGRGGGGVTLTPFGRALVRQYREFAAEVAALATRRWSRIGSTERASASRKRGLKPVVRAAGVKPSRRAGRARSSAPRPP